MTRRRAEHRWKGPKIAVFAAIGVMTLYVLFHNERFLIEPANPIWQHYALVAWWLIPHGVAGACALLLAPLQFSERLRARYTAAHRIIGRIYVAGALILAPLGATLQYVNESVSGASRQFTVLAIVDAALLMSTTAVAFLFAVRRRITLHRQWMTRSYAVALVFFEGRFVTGVLGLDDASEAVQTTIIWSCLALAMLLGELANSYNDIRAAARTPIAARSTARAEAAYSLEAS